MDLSMVLAVIKGLLENKTFIEIIQIVTTIAFWTLLADKLIVQLLIKFWPEKVFAWLRDRVRYFDENALDKLKLKYKETGEELERKLVKELETWVAIIEDKE